MARKRAGRPKGSVAQAPRTAGVGSVAVVSPPVRARGGTELSAELRAVVDAMAENLAAYDAGTWVSNGVEYDSEKDASRDAQKYKRYVAAAMGVEQNTLRSRAWTNGDGAEFALSVKSE